MNRNPLYVAGYPKSGTTWVTRLLGEALQCPTGGSVPEEDGVEIATEGLDRPGGYVIRKGHFVLDYASSGTEFVPARHRMLPALQEHQRVVLVVRDPRETLVSAAHYFKVSINEMVSHLTQGTGPVRALGSLTDYMQGWFDPRAPRHVLLKYEHLLENPVVTLDLTLALLDLVPVCSLSEAVERQSFETRRAEVEKGDESSLLFGKRFHERFLRTGQARTWPDILHREEARLFAEHTNALMLDLGYETNALWWEQIPR